MFNIKRKKKYFIGIALAIFFNTSAFAIDIKDIGKKVNKYFAAVADLAYVESIKNQIYSSKVLKEKVNKILTKGPFEVAEKCNITLENATQLSDTLFKIAENVNDKVKLDCKDRIYQNPNPSLDIYGSIPSKAIIVISSSDCVFYEVVKFFYEGLEFTKDQEQDFIAELTNENLTEYNKKELFNSLNKVKGIKFTTGVTLN